ncbi:MAG: lysine--tRNA ligase [Pseudomonadota bacterium]|nr:lysine--tRNA ligase [Pseudomonadota bacterium]
MKDDNHSNDQRDQHLIRMEKLKAWREDDCAYPMSIMPTHVAQDLLDTYQNLDTLPEDTISVCGRMMTRRIMGKASFTHIQDRSGQIQLYVTKDAIGEDDYNAFKHFDLGDIIEVKGKLFKTKKGELTIEVNHLRLLSKCLYAMPDKFHGLQDNELRFRQRYLDIMVNEESRKVFKVRSQVIHLMRRFFTEQDYMEVETPMLHQISGGATALPFNTHHNALDLPLFLRIAPELHLKRLIVGGFDRVFEINRCFRNEGLSTRHNPEFTSCEFYEAYANYNHLMEMIESLIQSIASDALGSHEIQIDDHTYDLSKPFKRITLTQAVLDYNPGLESEKMRDQAYLRNYCDKNDITYTDEDDWGALQYHLFEKTVESNLIEPTFITLYPKTVSPLARCCDDEPELVDRFELFIGGRELANGFNELNDPEDQAKRFEAQMARKLAGDGEAMDYDHDYIEALSYGLPPTAGAGIGVDRLVMLFTNQISIKEVILFPQMRPKGSAE